MATFSWTQPISGFGYARDACLASLTSGVSGITNSPTNLVTASYEPGDIFIFTESGLNPTGFSPSTDPTPIPNIFGSQVYLYLSGQLPTTTSTGSIDFVGGGTGGVSWTNTAVSGNEALQMQVIQGGIIGTDSAIPNLGYTVTGQETFVTNFQITDSIPTQGEVVFQLYDSESNTWHGVWVGTQEFFGLSNLMGKGAINPVIGQWQQIPFTAAEIGLNPGAVITGVAWGGWNQSASSTIIFSDSYYNAPTGSVVPSGYVDCDQDGSLGYWVLAHEGPLVHVPIVNTPATTTPLPLAPSFTYTGLVYNSKYNLPYFIGYDGTIYTFASSTVTSVTSPPSGVAAPARLLYTDQQNNLYTMFSTSNKVASYNIASSGWTTVVSPFAATLDTVAYASGIASILAGGTNTQSVSVSGSIVDMAFSAISNQVLVVDTSPRVGVYSVTQGTLSLVQTVSGFTGSPVHIASRPDGVQALITDTTNNRVDVLINTAGTWNQTSTVSLTAPTALAISVSGVTQALVCQPSVNHVSVLNNSVNAWSVSQTLNVTGPTSVAVLPSGVGTLGVVSTSTGVQFLTFNGAVWTAGSTITLTPVPTLVAVDQSQTNNNLMYAAATSGGNTTVYVFQNEAQVGSMLINSESLGVLNVVDWQVLLPFASGDLGISYYLDGVTGNKILTGLIPTSPVSSLYVPTVTDYVPIFLVANAHNIGSFYEDSTLSYTSVVDSLVGIYSGGTWTTVDLNNRNKISSLTTDPSGNIYAVCVDNELYKISSGGIIASGFPTLFSPPHGQDAGTPYGISKLIWAGSNLYASSSLAGGVITIIP